MDRIYSRKRIRIPKYNIKNNKRSIRKKKLLKILIILAIAITTLFYILRSVNPIFESLCISKARTISVDIINLKTSEVLKKYAYEDIVQIINNNEDNTNILKTDVVIINQIISDITTEITKSLRTMEREEIKIYAGALTGNKYFSASGPSIRIKLMQTGNIVTDIKTEFESTGINQSVYRIYLDITCNINILTPYKTISHQAKNQVLLVETVVVGGVPQTYYNLEGIQTSDTLNVLE